MSRARKVRCGAGIAVSFESGQRPRVQSHVASRLRLSYFAFFSCHTLARLSICLSRLSRLAVRPLPARRPWRRQPRRGRCLGARCAAGRRSSSRSTSTRPYSHTRIASSPRNGRARSTVNRRPRPEPPSACVPRDPGPYLVAAGRASTLSHILSKSPCCTPYSLRGPTPVGNAPCVRAVGRAMASVANS